MFVDTSQNRQLFSNILITCRYLASSGNNGKVEHSCMHSPYIYAIVVTSNQTKHDLFLSSDYDECADVSLNHCNETCLNNEGSFMCSCSGERVLSLDGIHCQDDCGGMITAPASIVMPSSANGSRILPLVECEWSIRVDEGNVVAANLSNLDTLQAHDHSSDDTCESSFEIRNGPSATSTMLKKHCLGSPVSGTVVSSTPAMHITWHSGSQAGLSMLRSNLTLQVTLQLPKREGK